MKVISFRQIMWICLLCLTAGCSSKLVVMSEPPGANVSISTLGGEKKVAGQTPLELTDSKISELLGLGSSEVQFVEFELTADTFDPLKFYLPSARWAQRNSVIKLSLLPKKDVESTKVNDIVNRLYAARKLIESRQYETALIEVEKVISLNKEIPQAFALKGAAFYLQGRWQEALESYKQVVSLDPQFPEAVKMIEKIGLTLKQEAK